MRLSRRESEYLKEMLKLEERGIPVVGPSHFSSIYGISRASAQRVLNDLHSKNLLVHHRRKGYSLSDEGRTIALYLFRRHRILEYALWKAGVPVSDACELAARMESALTREDTERLWCVVGRPMRCPCGHIIPEVE